MKNLITTFAGTALIQIVTILTGVLTARWLLPTGKGELTAIVLWPTLLTTLGSIGIWDAIVYYSAGRVSARLPRVLASAIAVSAVLSLILGGIGFFLLPHILTSHGSGTIALARWYLFFIPLTFVTLSAMAILQGEQRFSQFNAVRVLVYLGELTGVVLLYFAGAISVGNVLWVFLAARFITMTAAFFLAAQDFGSGLRPDWSTARQLVSYGCKVHVGTMADALNLRLDQLIMSVFLPTTALGLYVVAVSVGAVVTLVSSGVNIVLFPRLAAASESQRGEILGRFVRLTLALSLCVAVLLLILAPWLIITFFGSGFLSALPAARVLVVASILLNLNSIFVVAAKAFNYPIVASQGQFVGLAFTAVLLALLLPKLQGYGAAWASLGAYAATFMYLAFVIRRKTGLAFGTLFIPRREDVQLLGNALAEVRRRSGL